MSGCVRAAGAGLGEPMTEHEDQSYSTDEAAVVAGVTYRNVDHWAREGIVSPSVVDAAGSGFYRRYSFEDVVCLRVVALLRGFCSSATNMAGGVPLSVLGSVLGSVLERVRDLLEDGQRCGWLVLYPDGSVKTRESWTHTAPPDLGLCMRLSVVVDHVTEASCHRGVAMVWCVHCRRHVEYLVLTVYSRWAICESCVTKLSRR